MKTFFFAVLFTLSTVGLSTLALAIPCETTDFPLKHFNCNLKNQDTHVKLNLEISCRKGEYVYSIDHSPKKAVLDTTTALMESGADWEEFSFQLPEATVMFVSKYKSMPLAAAPIFNGFYLPGSVRAGEQVIASPIRGTCWGY